MLPDKSVKCHRTGFTMSCHTGVTEHGCRLWKRLTLTTHPEKGGAVDHYDCLDSLQEVLMKDMIYRQVQTTGSVDHLRTEVHQANDQAMVGAIGKLNARMDAALSIGASPAVKMIEG